MIIIGEVPAMDIQRQLEIETSNKPNPSLERGIRLMILYLNNRTGNGALM